MPALYKASVSHFIDDNPDSVVGILAKGSASKTLGSISNLQIGAWTSQIQDLQAGLGRLLIAEKRTADWVILLEYAIPVIGRRPDAILLADGHVLVIEYKAGSTESATGAFEQALGYACDLRDFHEKSRGRTIVPFALGNMKGGLRYANARGGIVTVDELASRILAVVNEIGPAASPLCADDWDQSRYFAVPTLVEAASAILDEQDVREISHSKAGSDNLASTLDAILQGASEARETNSKILCLVTGVPGAGKTLAGLHAISQLVKQLNLEIEQAAFLSGNSPLVNVLRKALGANLSKMRGKRVTARTLESSIQEVHRFVKDSYESKQPPAFRAIVFDEAQRAWSRARNREKFGRDISEPEMIFQIMDRHSGWALVVGLVGGGQEIHAGEAGLAAWGEALKVYRDWKVYCSPQALHGGDLVAGGTLFGQADGIDQGMITVREDLHLGVSKRSYDAESNSRWVNAVLEGRVEDAAKCAGKDFPVFLTRSLATARTWLKSRISPNRRSGLVASSGAARLRAEGVETPTFKFLSGIDYPSWFLKPLGDVRSSNQLEVAMSEFELQGLELDHVGLLWGGDLIFLNQRPVARKFWSAKWVAVRDYSPEDDHEEVDSSGAPVVSAIGRHRLVLNKYRVLMTRFRKAMIIFVPEGDESDPTRLPAEYDGVVRYLLSCGARIVETS